MSVLLGDAEISLSLRVTISLFNGKSHDDEISAPTRIIGIYMILFEQNCNNLKTDVIGRNM